MGILKGTKEERKKIWKDAMKDINDNPFQAFGIAFWYCAIFYTIMLGIGYLDSAMLYCDTGYSYSESYTKEDIKEGNIAFHEEMKYSDIIKMCEDGGCGENFNYVCEHNFTRWVNEIKLRN